MSKLGGNYFRFIWKAESCYLEVELDKIYVDKLDSFGTLCFGGYNGEGYISPFDKQFRHEWAKFEDCTMEVYLSQL